MQNIIPATIALIVKKTPPYTCNEPNKIDDIKIAIHRLCLIYLLVNNPPTNKKRKKIVSISGAIITDIKASIIPLSLITSAGCSKNNNGSKTMRGIR